MYLESNFVAMVAICKQEHVAGRNTGLSGPTGKNKDFVQQAQNFCKLSIILNLIVFAKFISIMTKANVQLLFVTVY